MSGGGYGKREEKKIRGGMSEKYSAKEEVEGEVGTK